MSRNLIYQYESQDQLGGLGGGFSFALDDLDGALRWFNHFLQSMRLSGLHPVARFFGLPVLLAPKLGRQKRGGVQESATRVGVNRPDNYG